MKSATLFSTLLTTAAFATTLLAAPPKIQGRTDKDSYRIGEEMTFTFTVVEDPANPDGTFVKWVRTGDDGQTTNSLVKVMPNTPLVVKTKADKPGFVRVWATLSHADGKTMNGQNTHFYASAGAEIEKMQSTPEPQDFDAFWASQKKKLAAVSREPVTREEIASKNPKVKLFKLSIPCAGPRPTTGYLIVPVGATPQSLPARLTFEGYGMGGKDAPQWYDDKSITFAVNAHGFELGKDEAYYKNFGDSLKVGKSGYAFDPEQNKNPETTYFNGMILRDLRALDYVKSLPEWNGKDLEVRGGSQGGFQSLVLAGLDHDITSCDAGVPWCCDWGGKAKLGRVGGWQPAYTPALDYYDPVNHAKRIPATCKVFISRAGLGDDCCPASGLAVAYNNLKCPKKIRFVQGSEHMHWGGIPAGTQVFTLEENFK